MRYSPTPRMTSRTIRLISDIGCLLYRSSRRSIRALRRADPPRDPFRDLRDDRVAEPSKAVHPSGNPMSHSTHVGFNVPPTTHGSVLPIVCAARKALYSGEHESLL